MFFIGHRAVESFLPQRLVGPFSWFTALVGLFLLISSLVPGSVGQYQGSLEAAHAGRLFLYALTVLTGILGLQIGEELGGLPYTQLPVRRQILHLAGLDGLGLMLAGPFLVIYRAWTGSSWSSCMLSLSFLAFHVACWSLAGVALATVITLDERRFVAKYALLAAALFASLPASFPLSPLVAVTKVWEAKCWWPGVGSSLPAAVGLLSLGVWLWRRRMRSSVAHGGGAEHEGLSVER